MALSRLSSLSNHLSCQTSLVAMVVGIFDFVEGVTSQGTKVRMYTEVGKREQGKFALDVGVKSLDLYNE